MNCGPPGKRPRPHRYGRGCGFAIAALLSIGSPIHSQPCEWEEVQGGEFSSRVWALARFDAGGAPHLYAGGGFRESSGSPASFIAGWDGSSWSALGQGLGNGVKSLRRFDDGRGPALFVGGPFYRAGEILDANGVARWDGVEWSALGTGIRNFTDPPAAHNADAMIVFDDGSGPALYVGGHFTHAGGIPALNIARWDGAEWTPLGEGLYGSVGVRALAVYDDGSGPALYAGGYFEGGVARWDGESWSTIGGGWAVHIDARPCSTMARDRRYTRAGR
jgi:hypothetical protein